MMILFFYYCSFPIFEFYFIHFQLVFPVLLLQQQNNWEILNIKVMINYKACKG